jgi:hypothetical protein
MLVSDVLILHSDCIKDHGVMLESKLYFRCHVDFLYLLALRQYSVRLWAGRSGFDPQQGYRIFLIAPASRPSLGAHPASCPKRTGGKARPGRDADHSPPSSAEVKYE